MITDGGSLTVRLAQTEADLIAAQRLRYDVFVSELGGDGALVDHDARLERDEFDPYCDHMLVEDGGEVVAVYRLMRSDQAARAGRFYCDSEYDLSRLETSGRSLLELGRSCLAPSHRGGGVMHQLWRGLGAYVERHDSELLFGVASFHGLDLTELAAPLSLLHHDYLAPEPLRVRSRAYQPLNLHSAEELNRKAAIVAMPSLIKAYLRLGGVVGDGAYLDHEFNTTDVLLILDTTRLAKGAERYRS